MNDTDKRPQLLKAATGIDGLDAITEGGLPAGLPTLLCGAAGCGKTLFGLTFLVEGAQRFDEAGVLMTFEERPEDITDNVGSLGYDLPGLISSKKLMIDQVKIERGESEESAEAKAARFEQKADGGDDRNKRARGAAPTKRRIPGPGAGGRRPAGGGGGPR